MKLCFDSVEEVRAFVKDELKGARRGGKDEPDVGNQPPPPMQPPQTGGAMQGFPGAPQVAGAGPQGGAFPAHGAPQAALEVLALAGRIRTRLDATIASGQPAADVTQWMRNQCGAEAASATLDQIKDIFLPKMSAVQLESIAKMIAA